MSEQTGNEYEEEGAEVINEDDIMRIAEEVGAKNYFLSEQSRNLDEWSTNASQIFRNTGQVLISEYELKSSKILDNYQDNYNDSYARSKKEFDAFCILNRKVKIILKQVQKKNDGIQNLAVHCSQKNTKKSFFNGWKAYADYRKYLRMMEDQSKKYQEKRTMKLVLKSWLQITMENTKTKIKNEVLQKTEVEVGRIQTEYEKLIKNLEEALEKKLNELRKEEEEHKQMHDKYENMYSRARVEQASERS